MKNFVQKSQGILGTLADIISLADATGNIVLWKKWVSPTLESWGPNMLNLSFFVVGTFLIYISIFDNPKWLQSLVDSIKHPKKIPFTELRNFGLTQGLPLDDKNSEGANIAYDMERKLTEMAANSKIDFWGRENRTIIDLSPLVQIPSDHFKKFNIAHGFLNYEVDNSNTYTTEEVKRKEENKGTIFCDLHLLKRDAVNFIKKFKREIT